MDNKKEIALEALKSIEGVTCDNIKSIIGIIKWTYERSKGEGIPTEEEIFLMKELQSFMDKLTE